MRLITGGLTAILATLAPASSTFGAVNANTNTNTLAGTVGPGFAITMNKKTVKAGYHFVCDPHRTIMHGVLKVT
jgi:Copper binding proteins, plastocyanin/azurin family